MAVAPRHSLHGLYSAVPDSYLIVLALQFGIYRAKVKQLTILNSVIQDWKHDRQSNASTVRYTLNYPNCFDFMPLQNGTG